MNFGANPVEWNTLAKHKRGGWSYFEENLNMLKTTMADTAQATVYSDSNRLWRQFQTVRTIAGCNNKNPSYGRHWLSTCADNSIVSKKLSKTCGSDLKHMPVLKALCREIRNRTQGKSTSPIRNTSLFLRLYPGTIHKSNTEQLLVFKAPSGDGPRVQSETPPCF